MSNFSLDARLDTTDPLLIEFLGPPSAVVHKVAGKLVMTVTKPVQLKQLTVAFVGQGTKRLYYPFNCGLDGRGWQGWLVVYK